MNRKRLTTEEYIERCKNFNPEYDYSKIGFTTISGQFVTPICKKHGKFRINASGLMSKKIECPECKREKRFNEFVEKARLIHGDKYEYDINTYKNNKIPIRIICPIHGEFKQAIGDHLKGYGCSKCSGKYKPSTEEWIEKAAPVYNYIYDYSKVNYIDNKTPVTVICPKHGEFYPIPNNHIKGVSGCPKCASELRHEKYKKSTEQFIIDAKKIHGNKYNYDKVIYYNKETPIIITCPIHGDFEQRPDSHLSGSGCSKCVNKNQALLFEKLKSTFPNINILYEVGNKTIPWIKQLRFDIYFPDYNIAVEYDGQQHYIPIEKFGGELKFEQTQKLDLYKNQLCKENNCHLFRVKYNYTNNDYIKLTEQIKNIINIKHENTN